MSMKRSHKHVPLRCLIMIIAFLASHIPAYGGTWSFLGFDNYAVIDLDIDPDSSKTVLALVRSDSTESLFKTDNGGNSWDYLNNAPSDLGAVAIDPNNPSVIWAGGGHETSTMTVCVPSYKSMDGGQTWPWSAMLCGDYCDGSTIWGCSTGINDILIKPDDSDTVLISMDPMDGQLQRTTDGGDNWAGWSSDTSSLAVDPLYNNYMYAGSCHILISTNPVYASSNGGESWGELSLNGTWPGTGCVYDLEVNWELLEDYGGYAHLYAATGSGLIKTVWSEETGWSWEKMSGLPTDDITALAIDLSNIPGTIYAGTNGYGVFVSQDGGSMWTAFNEGLGNLYITKLTISKNYPKILYAGTADGVWSWALEGLNHDFNEDGYSDILGVNSAGVIWWYDIAGDTWNNVTGSLEDMVVGDFDGDTISDIAGRNASSQIWWHDISDETWALVPGSLASMVAGDFNGDGNDDLAGLNSSGRIWWRDVEGAAWYNIPGTLASLVVGDFNGDGKDDLAGLNSNGWIWWYDMDGAAWHNIPGSLESLVTGDFIMDGKDDLAGLNSSGQIWFYDMDGAAWYNIPGTMESLVVGDFDGDGSEDLAGLNTIGQIWYTTNGSTWQNIPGSMASLVVGDYDRDGDDDLSGLNASGMIWYTTDLSTWQNIPGSLEELY
jgi:hypothetical protein